MRERNIKETVPKNDLALIERVLDFASWKVIESQEQVYSWLGDHPYVPKQQNPDGSLEPALQKLNVEDGVGPLIEDQRSVKAALRAIANKDFKGIDKARDDVIIVLGETYRGQLRLGWYRGQFRITVEPMLFDVRA